MEIFRGGELRVQVCAGIVGAVHFVLTAAVRALYCRCPHIMVEAVCSTLLTG